MGLFDPKCEVCEKRTPKKLLREGYCPDCYDTLLQYVELRDYVQAITGKTISIAPKDIIKMSEKELQAAVMAPFEESSKAVKEDPFISSNNFTLEELRDRGIKRVRFFTLKADCPCEVCRKMNSRIMPIDQAIAYENSEGLNHRGCDTKWVPLRERDPNADPDSWKKNFNT